MLNSVDLDGQDAAQVVRWKAKGAEDLQHMLDVCRSARSRVRSRSRRRVAAGRASVRSATR